MTIGKETFAFVVIHTTAPISAWHYMRRNKQLANIAKNLKQIPKKNDGIVVVGDFNVTPWSFHYKKFESTIGLLFQNILLHNKISMSWDLSDV